MKQLIGIFILFAILAGCCGQSRCFKPIGIIDQTEESKLNNKACTSSKDKECVDAYSRIGDSILGGEIACNSPEINKKEFVLITVDTDFSKGRLGLEHEISLLDVEKFHGHLCDGLVVGFLGLQEGLEILYPDGKIDRTNTRIVSGSSPCLGDAAVYLCGSRYQFNTFYVSNSLDGLYVIQRIDNSKAVRVSLNKGVKPKEIDVLGKKAVAGQLNVSELQQLKKLEDDFTEYLLSTNPKDNFTVKELISFIWDPVLKNDFVKTDILNKNK